MKSLLMFVTAVVILASLPIQAIGATSDWPQWRGPNRDGHSPDVGLLKQWPAGGPTFLWKASGLGSGYTSVSVVGRPRLRHGREGECQLRDRVDRSDGKTLWTANVGKAGAPGWGGFAGPRCTPTVDGDLVFAVGQYGEVPVASGHRQGALAQGLRQGFRRHRCPNGASPACRWWTATA